MSDQIRAEAEIDSLTHQIGERLHELPEENYTPLRLIIGHLRRVADNSDVNMMGPKNLGTVFGPTLMRAGEDKVTSKHFMRILNIILKRDRWVVSWMYRINLGSLSYLSIG